ncbi:MULTISPECIES: MFS transporter [unclassified Bacillus (in: firmicutes)]|uniref:MFS transporter n=1 Tax=unclassified Bacillus (in: firmicutes) TaxID=185979 RepID=UPI0008EA6AE2|nr:MULTISPECIES: MFS transporter [unclassified Bacillus (in: firmicutes)]SFA91023.1 MFS transporter, DHA2 family, metal-tetracycline-proton antiporter [Bacillus sp. UNCCL13]SFQ85468.1 MFS transporter, DHA2 family, metal-tetracycline-proton antiporter [Bacillus sp. cl95]
MLETSALTLQKESPVIDENKIVLIWSFTVWLVVMNTTMFNVALPSVLEDLSLTSGAASWIVSGYSIVFAISTLTFSRLSDYLPISRLLYIGITILSVASLIGFFSDDFYLLLISRILQAAGAGAVPGLAMVLASRYIPVSRRGKAMSFIASAASLGFGLGPVIGGAITQYFGWEYLFIVTAIVILLIPLFNKYLPIESIEKVNFDILGGLVTGVSVTGLLLFFSTFSYWILLISIALLLFLWKHINKIEMPFIQPKLLLNKQYLKLLFIGFSAFITHFSSLFLLPIILTQVFHLEPAKVGMIIFPGAILSAVAAQFIGRLIDRFGNVPLIIGGQSLLILATLLFALFSNISAYLILFIYMFMSTGFSALTSSISNEISRILTKDELGSGMGMAQLIQFFGGAFGVALTGLALHFQENFSTALVHRSIFFGTFGLVFLSIFVFSLYLRRKKGL